MISTGLLPVPFREQRGASFGGVGTGTAAAIGGGLFALFGDRLNAITPGQVAGVVVDASGAAVAGARVTVTNSANGLTLAAVTDAGGHWVVSNFPSGNGKIQVDATGFRTLVQQFNYDASRPVEYVSPLSVGSATETVQVAAQAANGPLNGRSYDQFGQLESNTKKRAMNPASAKVMNLQRRVAGVLPVAIDVPRSGSSFQFARALVLDEETKVTFSYKSR